MKKQRLLLLPILCLLALLAGCSQPGARDIGLIPQTGPQSQEGFPPPVSSGDTGVQPQSDPGQVASTPNSLTASPPAIISDPSTPEPRTPDPDPDDEEEEPTQSTEVPSFTPEVLAVTTSPAVTNTPSPSATRTVRATEPATATVRASATPAATTATTGPAPAATITAVTATTPVTATQPPAVAAPTALAMARESLLGKEQLFTALSDSQVRNLDQGEIGEATGMVFDSLTGMPLFVVVDPGDWESWLPGITRPLVPVPWGAVNLAFVDFYQPQAGVLLLPVADHVLSTAPTIDVDLWDGRRPPDEWDTGIVDYWDNFVPIVPVTGTNGSNQAAGEQTGAPMLLEERDLRGRGIDVTDSEGETIGRVKDVVLDANGNALYAVVLVDDFFGLGGRLAPVPWNRLVWSPGEWFILEVSPALLQAAPGYPSRDNFPDFSQPDWDREIRGYWDPQ